jgi:hypothetical protein
MGIDWQARWAEFSRTMKRKQLRRVEECRK